MSESEMLGLILTLELKSVIELSTAFERNYLLIAFFKINLRLPVTI